jgi:hypothetical protein
MSEKDAPIPADESGRNPSQHEKSLFKVMVAGTSVSFGILAAVIVSMKDFLRGNASFEFSFWTVVAFVAGCALGWLFWRIVGRWVKKNKQSGST